MIRSGLLGRSILASRSPWLHEQEARAEGLELSYELFDFDARGLGDEDLGGVLSGLRDDGFAGVNVTYPFKQVVIPLLDGLDASAEAVGAVNTVAMREGRLVGYNTDAAGFRDGLRAGLPDAALCRVLQLGAGGAGTAVADALLSLGVGQLDLADVDAARADALANRLRRRYGDGRVAVRRPDDHDLGDVDGVVNATPIGMTGHPGTPIDPRLLEPRHWVADIVYFPRRTELLSVAEAIGCATLDGSGMVVGQAALAFEIFTGVAADRNRMRRSFEAFGA